MKKLQNNFTIIEQAKRLLELGVPADSADCAIFGYDDNYEQYELRVIPFNKQFTTFNLCDTDGSPWKLKMPCWSLSTLLEYMNHNSYNISLKCSGVEYTITFDDGKIYKTITRDYAIDAAVEMVIWLKRLNEIIKSYIGSRDNLYEYVMKTFREEVNEEF